MQQFNRRELVTLILAISAMIGLIANIAGAQGAKAKQESASLRIIFEGEFDRSLSIPVTLMDVRTFIDRRYEYLAPWELYDEVTPLDQNTEVLVRTILPTPKESLRFSWEMSVDPRDRSPIRLALPCRELIIVTAADHLCFPPTLVRPVGENPLETKISVRAFPLIAGQVLEANAKTSIKSLELKFATTEFFRWRVKNSLGVATSRCKLHSVVTDTDGRFQFYSPYCDAVHVWSVSNMKYRTGLQKLNEMHFKNNRAEVIISFSKFEATDMVEVQLEGKGLAGRGLNLFSDQGNCVRVQQRFLVDKESKISSTELIPGRTYSADLGDGNSLEEFLFVPGKRINFQIYVHQESDDGEYGNPPSIGLYFVVFTSVLIVFLGFMAQFGKRRQEFDEAGADDQ